MILQLLRHATLLIEYGGQRFLVDPMLSPQGAMPPIEQSPNPRPNPLVPLPDVDLDRVLRHIDAVIVTHLHRDHWDPEASRKLDKGLPLFCQPGDAEQLQEEGFRQVRPVQETHFWERIHLTRTGGEHGFGRIGEMMGQVSGFILKSEGQKALYIAGDTRWCPAVQEALHDHQPAVVVVNTGGARFLKGEPITMDPGDVIRVCQANLQSTVVAVHMEAINHCVVTREMLGAAVEEAGVAGQVLIPPDGEYLHF
jgi:L-ascorbate metabolism protein UlaG (beta-lactamase superfamily)